MSRLYVSFALAAIAIATISCVAYADQSQEAFDQGRELLLKNNDTNGAIAKYTTAASLAPENTEYAKNLIWLRRTATLESKLQSETDPTRVLKLMQSLHYFYLAQGMDQKALANDTELYKKTGGADEAGLLAQTYIAMDKFSDAAKVLGSLGDKATPYTQGMLAFSLLKSGDKAGAAQIAKSIEVPQDLSSKEAYLLARMKAVAGETPKALELLVALFENTPQNRIELLKQKVLECEEFASISNSEAFKQAINTQSTLSGCSGGKSCATCPNRGKCGKSKNTEMTPN
jgi:hypothetical protein